MPTEVIRYVDPDAAGGADGTSWTDAYTALDTALENEEKDLVAADEKYTINCRSSGGTADTIGALIDAPNWTADATRFIEIIGVDFPADGILDETKYRIDVTNAGGIRSEALYTKIRNIQVKMTVTGAAGATGIEMAAQGDIDSCTVTCISSSTGDVRGITTTIPPTNVYNCIVTGVNNGADAGHMAYRHAAVVGGVTNFYNCVAWDSYHGFVAWAGGSDSVIENCISANNTGGEDFLAAIGGTQAIDFCASDDGDGTNAVAPSGADWDNEMNDPDNGDFSLIGGNCQDGGTDDPGTGLYSDDIIGATRTSAWSIGAYEAGASMGGRQLVNRGGGINSKLLAGRI